MFNNQFAILKLKMKEFIISNEHNRKLQNEILKQKATNERFAIIIQMVDDFKKNLEKLL